MKKEKKGFANFCVILLHFKHFKVNYNFSTPDS